MRILFVACYSPLINNSAAIETLQYLNNLVKEGNEVELLTVDFPKDCIYYDERLLRHIDNSIVVHKIDGGKVFNSIIPRKQKVDGDKNTNTSPLRKVLRKIKNLVIIPDMYFKWAKNASVYGNKLLKEKNFDVIFSMHEPPSSHICALDIKKNNRDIPWVTYWSDPWLKDSTRENSVFIKKYIEKGMEREVVELADSFIFVTKANMEDYVQLYGLDKSKCHILTRGYDEEVYNKLLKEDKPKLIKNNKLNLVYAGEIFSKLRDIRPFIEALQELGDEDEEAFNILNIMFFGNIDDNIGKEQLSAFKNVSVSGRIPYDEALKYTLFSEGLLLFGNKNSKQIPAKIYDYFGAKGKILAILGDENDPLKAVIENSERCIMTLNTKENIKKSIKEFIKLYKEDDIWGEQNTKYEWNNISKKLNKILKES